MRHVRLLIWLAAAGAAQLAMRSSSLAPKPCESTQMAKPADHLQIMEAIEALDPEHLCTDYWAGKHEREAAAAGLPVPSRAGTGRHAGGPRRKGGKRTR